MMQAGMFVTADAFTANVRSGIFTHFTREEDATLTHGKLDEELTRMNASSITSTQHHCCCAMNPSLPQTNSKDRNSPATSSTQ